MKTETAHPLTKREFGLLLALLLIVSGVAGYSEYRRGSLEKQFAAESEAYEERLTALASSTDLSMHELLVRITALSNESVALSGAVQNAQNRNEAVVEQIGKVSSTVGSLDKLSKTDPELLQKYSKVYFLNEHYIPDGLSTVAAEFAFNKSVTYQVHAKISTPLDNMLKDAKAAGLSLQVISAYRSFDTQSALKAQYKVTYGAGTANQFSADQGYSEHQLGTTLDFTTPKVGGTFDSFDATPEFKWLADNAHKYGFVLSYPKNNRYYVYEPWHWRYIGRDLATRLKSEGKYFYDLEQRVIDNYLLLIFE